MKEQALRNDLSKANKRLQEGKDKIAILNLQQEQGTVNGVVNKSAFKAIQQLEKAWQAKSALQGEVNRCERNLKNFFFNKYL